MITWIESERPNFVLALHNFVCTKTQECIKTSWRNYTCKFFVVVHMAYGSNRKMTGFRFAKKYSLNLWLAFQGEKERMNIEHASKFIANAECVYIFRCFSNEVNKNLSHLPHHRECIEFGSSAVSSSMSCVPNFLLLASREKCCLVYACVCVCACMCAHIKATRYISSSSFASLHSR